MSRRLRHRGPDDDGTELREQVGFVHRRLSIIDLSTGQQPMTLFGVTIAFNGEIYNYVELRDELRLAGHEFRTSSDTEVLLRMYLQYGTDAIARLNGMFAFVLYDGRHDRVVAARDHFGIKPLYSFRDRNRLIYASEIKAFFADESISAQVNQTALQDYLTLQYTLGDSTLFEGVRKLPPSHYEITDVGSGETRRSAYWELAFDTDRECSEGEYLDELQWLLRDAVQHQMRSDVPVGAYLSGGLDSSTVTVLASRIANQSLQTFTGAFREGPEYDESEYASAVAESCGAQMHFVYPTEKDFIDLLPKLVYHMDEPAAGPGLFPQYVVSSVAAQHVKVCLGGQGGDEIFGGYARYLIAYLEQALKASIRGAEGLEGEISLGELAPNMRVLKQYEPLLQRFLSRGTFDAPDRRYFSLIDRSEGTIGTFSPDFRELYNGNEVFERFAMEFAKPDTRSYYNQMLHYDMRTGLQALLHVEDRVSMSVSLESRVPLLDPRIVEFVARVPLRIKFKGGEMKYLFKRAIRDLLPSNVLNRQDKMGFPVPLQQWSRGNARDFFGDVLLGRRARERGLYEISEVERLIHSESSFSRVLWGLLQLELWHQQFIDAGSAG